MLFFYFEMTHTDGCSEILGNMRQDVESEGYGYTQAVDLWAVGCVTVVLLTGGLAFCDPTTNLYSEKLARECNLDFLHKSKDWRLVRQRPADFVAKLLVRDGNTRSTAEEALQHPWFYNEVHKNDFNDLYQRTIKHWHPRSPKQKIVEFQDNGSIRGLECSQAFLGPPRICARGHTPVEPHYKPFPRHVHQILWPPRSPTKGISEEVLGAMEKSSPASASRLRTRPQSTSPQPQATSPTDRATKNSLRPMRAASEPLSMRPPLLVRVGSSPRFPPRFRASPRKPTSFLPAVVTVRKKNLQQARQRSEERQAVSPTPAPKLRREVSVEIPCTPWQSSSNSARTTSAETSTSEQILPGRSREPVVDRLRSSSPPPHILRNLEPSGSPAYTESQTSRGSSHDIATPRSNSKLKRRPSTPLMTPTFKKHRGSSIFDLAEDSNAGQQPREQQQNRRSIFELTEERPQHTIRLPRLSLAHRPRASPVPEVRHHSRALYLPR
jgi:hypothetical protein